MSVIEFKHNFFDSLNAFLWRQWIQLGISGQISTDAQRYVIDPEALLLFSSNFCRYDQRLYDLIIDWLNINGNFMNIQRLKAMQKKMHCRDDASLGVMLNTANDDGKERRLKKLAESLRPQKQSDPVPLFINYSGTTETYSPRHDIKALQYGFIRNTYQPSGKVTRFPSNSAATFLLQLRGIFGLSARAEAILILLGKDSCKIQDIADLSGYSWKSIQDVMAELTASGIVTSLEGRERGSHFYLKHTHELLMVFNQQDAVFPEWKRIFNSLYYIWKTISNPVLETLSEKTFQGEIQDCFESQIGSDFLQSGIDELKFMSYSDIDSLPQILQQI